MRKLENERTRKIEKREKEKDRQKTGKKSDVLIV
jgi:hypothetical protein